MRAKFGKKNLKAKLRLGFLICLPLLIVLFLLIANKTNNWQFFSEQSIGPNNQFEPYDNLIFSDGLIIFNSQDKNTYALKQKTGQLAWQFNAQNYSPFPAAVFNNQVYLANFDGHIYCLDKQTGQEHWRFNIPEQINPDTPVVVSPTNQQVFFATRDGKLIALDALTGQEIWHQQFTAPDSQQAFTANTIHFGALYLDEQYLYAVNAPEKSVSAFNLASGKMAWQIKNFNFSFNAPILTKNFAVFKQTDRLIVVNKNTGQQTIFWRQGAQDSFWQAIQPDKNQDILLILDHQQLSKIDLLTKQKLWSLDGVYVDWAMSTDLNNQQPIYIDSQQILVQRLDRLNNQNILQAIDYQTGQLNWQTTLFIDTINSIIPYRQTLLLGEKNGHLIAINQNSGEVKWQTKLSGEIIRLQLSQNKLLVVTQDDSKKNNFYYLNLEKNGQAIWQYNPDQIINQANIYFTDQAFYTLDKDKQLLEKITFNAGNPENKNLKKLNFTVQHDIDLHDLKNPYLEYQLREKFSWKVKKLSLQIGYILRHWSATRKFIIQPSINSGLFIFEIKHDQQLYQNPFTALDVSAVFTNQATGQEIKIKGYYEDQDTWKLKFRPPETGTYSWRLLIISSFGRQIWSGKEMLTADGNQPLTINGNNFAVGNQVFFPLGIQDAFVDRNYDGSFTDQIADSSDAEPVNSTTGYHYLSLAQHLQLYQQEAGINIFRYGVDNWALPLYQSLKPGEIKWDINGSQFGDQLVTQLKANQIRVMMTIFGFHPPFDSKEEIKKPVNQRAVIQYLDYVIARFSVDVDLWEISNEAKSDQNWYELVINYLQNHDPYHHPISTNWEEPELKGLNYLSIHSYQQNSSASNLLSESVNSLKISYQDYQQPIILSELGFRNVSWFPGSNQAVRVLAWLDTFNGIGTIFWNQGQNGVRQNPDNANVYLGPIERQYLLNLANFMPKMDLPIERAFNSLEAEKIQIFTLKNHDYLLLYLLKALPSNHSSIQLPINLDSAGDFSWFNPQTGLEIKNGKLAAGKNILLLPPFENDLALKITYQK